MECLDQGTRKVLEFIGHEQVRFPTDDDLKFPPSRASEELARNLYTADLMFAVQSIYSVDFEALAYE